MLKTDEGRVIYLQGRQHIERRLWEAVRRLRTKAPGIDRIPAELIKQVGKGIHNVLYKEAILALKSNYRKKTDERSGHLHCFCWYWNAFDSVSWKVLFEVLKQTEIKYKERTVICSLYKNKMSVVICGGCTQAVRVVPDSCSTYIIRGHWTK